jgi:hypothetical protein
LLDIPNELFEPIIRTIIQNVGVANALKYREVCNECIPH